jgi:hypothetical protein
MRKILFLLSVLLFSNIYADAVPAPAHPGLDVVYSPSSLNIPESALKLMKEIQKGDDTVQVIYYKSGDIYMVSKMQISFQKLNKKYFNDMTQDSFESTKNIFCTLREKAKTSWPVIENYNYIYDVVSIENIWVGRITADPKKILCD